MKKIRLAWQRMRAVPGLRNDLVVLAVLVAIGVASGGYIVSHYEAIFPWEDRVELTAEFDHAPAIQLDARQEVRIAGVPVGKIVDAKPTRQGTALVTMSIEPGHQIYDNARLVLRSKNPLNVMYVALNPGGPPGRPLPSGEVIPASQTERVLQPYELVDKLDERTQAALTSLVDEADVALAQAPKRLPGGLRATDATLASFQPVVEKLRHRRGAIQRLVTAFARISAAAGEDDQRLASLASSLQETLAVLAKRDKELGAMLAELPGLTSTLRNSMKSTAKLTEELNPALDSMHSSAGKLPSAVSRLSKTVGEADGLVRDARPVMAKARPVLADLRPLIGDVNSALTDFRPVVATLPKATQRIVPWLDDLSAFVYHTSSSFSLGDVNGGLGRAQVNMKVDDPSSGGSTPQNSRRGVK